MLTRESSLPEARRGQLVVGISDVSPWVCEEIFKALVRYDSNESPGGLLVTTTITTTATTSHNSGLRWIFNIGVYSTEATAL